MSTISSTINHAITVTGAYASPLTITNTGAVNNNGASDAVYGTADATTVVNQGSVTATGNGAYGGFNGIALAGLNSIVDNQGRITAAGQGIVFYGATASITNSGTITSNHWGVETRGPTTLSNSGTISASSQALQLFSYGGNSTVTNTGRIFGSNGIGISQNAGTVNNSGTITGTYGTAIILSAGGSISNSSTGIISQSVGAYSAVVISGAAGSVTNAGTISGYDGIQFSGAFNNTVIDSGTITGIGGNAILFDTGNDLLKFTPSTTIKIQGTVGGGAGTNTLEFASAVSAGTLTGVGADFANFTKGTIDSGASWVFAGTDTFASSTTLTNSGTLSNTGTLTNAGVFGGTGVFTTSGKLSNSGTITDPVTLSGSAYLGNTGNILASSGAGIKATGAVTIVNSGTIDPPGPGVYLTAGGTLTNNSAGYVGGGAYGVKINGTAAATITNAGTITGTLGVTVAGSGTAAQTIIDSGTISGSGGTAIAFGAGNDFLKFTPSATVKIQGTVDGGTGTNTLEFASAASAGTLTGVGADFVNFGNGTVDAGASWVFAGTNTIGSSTTLTNSGTLSNTGTLTNAGALNAPGTYTALSIASGGVVSNTATGTITGGNNAVTASGTASVSNLGSITGTSAAGISVNAGSGNLLLLTNGIGGVISGGSYAVRTGYTTLTNRGTIQATGTHSTGVFLAAGGNDGIITNYGVLSGTYYGIHSVGDGSLNNSGTISSTGRYGVRFDGGNPSVTNSGTISANNGLVMLANGTVNNTGTGLITGLNALGIRGTGSVSNSATIYASNGTGLLLGTGGTISNAAAGVISAANYDALNINGGAGTVVNAGTISGGTGITFGDFANTVTDSGTIAGTSGTAVAFGTGNDLLKFTPSATVKIQGTVDGGTGTNTLEFASAASAGTLTGVGAYFVNFGTGTVDAGASWVFAGTNTIGSSTTLTNSGTLSNTGTLTNAGSLNAPGTYTALSIASGGVVSNTATGTITGGNNAITASGTASVSNLGSITGTTLSGIALVSGTVVNGATNNTAARVAGRTSGIAASGTATVVNYATITASGTASFGVTLLSGGVVNGASGDTVAVISGAAYGVRLQAGQISNYGTLTGNVGARINATGSIINHAGALIVGTSVGFTANGASQTVSNLGTIQATSGNGVVASGNGVVIVNGTSGSTSGLISAGARGVVLQANGSDTLFNYGTITGAIGIYDNGASGAVNATVINAGTIIGTGGTAIHSGAIGSSNLLLRFVPGNSFIQGTVSGERAGVGVLQFASGASTGTLTGSNAVFTNFQTASVFAGAAWVFAGTDTFASNTTLTNYGTLTNTGTLSGTGPFTTSGRLNNSGTINKTVTLSGSAYLGNTGNIIASSGPGVSATGAVTIVNSGTIDPPGPGIYLAAGGLVTNNAGGYIGGGAYGIKINGTAAATVTNAGTIAGTLGVTIAGSGTAGQTIIDSGTIVGSGGTAVAFGAGNDFLVLENGYKLVGNVVGAGGSNAIELRGSAAGRVTATYNNLSLTNFGTVGFTPGDSNYATLRITNNATLPNTITNFTGVHDTIDLTALSYVTGSTGTYFDTVSNALTVTAGGNAVTLQLGAGSYSNAHWAVANDGSGGTDITVSGSGGQTNFLIHNETELNAAFAAISVGGVDSAVNTSFTLTFANGFALNGTVNGVTLASGSSVTIDGAGFTLDGGGAAYGFINSTSPITIKDLAIVDGQAAISSGGYWSFVGSDTIGGTATLTNSGTLSDTGTLSNTGTLINGGVFGGTGVFTTSGKLSNSGTITDPVTLTGSAYLGNTGKILASSGAGIKATGAVTIVNSGTIDPPGPGVYLTAGGTLTNNAAGYVGGGAYGVKINGTATATITNAGTIAGTIGVTVAGSGTAAQTIIDSGAIIGSGGTAVAFGAGNDLLKLTPSASLSIQGAVDGGSGTNTLELGSAASAGTLAGLGTSFQNFGLVTVDTGAQWTIAGASSLASGGLVSVYGSLTNTGALTLAGSASMTLFTGGYLKNTGSLASNKFAIAGYGAGGNTIINTGTITNAGTGADILLATGGYARNDGILVAGTQSSGIVVGVGASGTVVNTGSITALGTPSYGVRLNGGGFVTNTSAGYIQGGIAVNGGAGSVGNAGSIGGLYFYGVRLSQGGTVTDSGRITAYNAGIRIDAAGYVGIAAGGYVGASHFAGVLISGVATVVNSGSIQSGTAAVISGGGTVTGYFGVYGGAGGHLTNTGSGAITGGIGVEFQNAAATVANAGSITGTVKQGVLLLAGGSVGNTGFITTTGTTYNNSSGPIGAVALSGASAGTVSNSGTIAATYAPFDGVDLFAGGSLDNTGTIIGGYFGVYARGGLGTVTNTGIIRSLNRYGVGLRQGGNVTNSGTGFIDGGIAIGYGAGTVVDSGTISNPNGAGIGLSTGGSVTVSGLVTAAQGVQLTGTASTLRLSVSSTGTISGGSYGVYIKDGNSTIVNDGKVTGGVGIGVSGTVTGNQTVIDSGAIIGSGGTAVAFGAGDDLLKLTPSASLSIQGTADGGGGINTLEFASAASHGTLTGTNASFAKFGQGTIDSGAYWVFAGSNTIASTTTLANSGTATVSGTLTNLGSINNQGLLTLAGNQASPATLVDSGFISGAVAFAAGASNFATLRITNTANLPGTIVGFTGAHDFVDITQLSDASNHAVATLNTATNVLTVTGDNGSVQLQLDAEDYTGVGWAVSNDGSGGSKVSVQFDTSAPSATANNPVTVGIQGTVILTSAHLRFDDNLSSHAEETYTITAPPARGTLLKNGVEASTFTQADIDNGLVSYRGNGGGVNTIGFTVSDAAGNTTAEQQYRIIAPGAPHLDGFVYWRDDFGGDTGYWKMLDGSIEGWHELGGSGNGYQIAGVGNFNFGVSTDILWQNSANGDTGYWKMVAGSIESWFPLPGASPSYQVAAVGDVTGDRADDILWRNNADGDTGYWKMLDGSVDSWHALNGASINYQVAGIGDLDSDGNADILWRNDADGDTGYWRMVAGAIDSWVPLPGSSPNYQVAAVADLTGDGTADILWRNAADGDTGYWKMIAGSVDSWVPLPGSSPNYQVAATGDYTSDGATDILWRNAADGDTGYWKMVGGSAQSWVDLGQSSLSYHVAL